MGDPVDERKRTTLRRFAALGATAPFAGLASGAEGSGEESASRSEVPDAIRGYLSTTPGAHFSKLRDDLKLGTGETQHHLRALIDAEAVEARRDGEYRRFFPAGQFSEFERTALGYLRRETPRRMVIELLESPAETGSELADRLSVSRATVSTYAGDLEAAGLLDRSEQYVVAEPETVLMLLLRYANSFGPDAVDFAARADDLIRVDRA
ncbi:winged helix-turn-helix transcriptional regulator [Halohasta salina]|uniref:winged helix-turn-helix transcriptional regulator n=1 Tax=Halohasta salina TaxID=2961621 RepID=UPI0020A4EECD|nr:HTH domain-containing protein [Halohasta salina]